MESPNMYDQQQLQQVDLKPKIMSPTSSTPTPANASSNGTNSANSNNNNNSNMQVNHNQQQQIVNGVSKVSGSKASLHQQYAEHCAAAGELTDLNNPEMTLDLQQLIDESSPFVNDAGILEILGNGLKHHQRPQPHTANSSYNPRSTLAYMPQPVHSAAGYQPPHHHQQQHHANSNSGNNNSCSDSNSSCSESPSIKEEPVDATDFRRHCQQQQQPGYAQVQGYPAFQQFAQALPPLHQTANPHLQQIQQQHNQGRPGAQKLGAGLVGTGQQVARKQSKSVDKASDEYRRRRERNNIAVRKSREKAKVRTRETEERVKILMKDNDSLRKKVVELNEEVSMLKSLFHNVGMLPEQLQRELSRHLDQFPPHGQAI